MKIITLTLSLFILHSTMAIGQDNNLKPFTLEGSIALDSGTIVLQMIADSNFYNPSAQHLKSQIHNGKFSIKGEIPHPMAYTLVAEDYSYSDMIIIKPGVQSIDFHKDIPKEKLFVDQISKDEHELFRGLYKEYSKKLAAHDQKYDELQVKYKSVIPDSLRADIDKANKSLYAESDQILLSFVKRNPGSFLGLWSLIRLTSWGYEKTFDDVFANYTEAIRNSYAGKMLASRLMQANVLALGKQFPFMKLSDKYGQKSQGMVLKKNKYTLVDFWYTDCAPCRAQFPSFINTYKLYHPKGFELVGISTDAVKYKEELPKVIKELALDWTHFWDIDGKETAARSIKAFPTNFLLDQKGVIIQKNISPAELALFLKENL
jgi:thiol-disulfide isomerase/thioredoxin